MLRVLVGNKIDRDDHEIPLEVGEEFANRSLIVIIIDDDLDDLDDHDDKKFAD